VRLAWLPLLALAYLVGSIPTGLWLGRLVAGKDVRSEGSHRSGATNVQRVLGTWAGITVAAVDTLKGTAAVLVVQAASHDPYLAGLAGVVAVAGHIWTVFGGFEGGRGVATTAGAVLALAPVVFVCAFLVMATVVLGSRYMSLGSIAAAYALGPLAAIWLGHSPESDAVLLVGVLAGGLVALKHADNVERLLHGRERRFELARRR